MEGHQGFGASIGKALADACAGDGAPKVAAAQFMSGAVDANARVKLPAILGNNAVREWMQRLGISESMMRSALTNERRLRREQAAQPEVQVPPKRRVRRSVAATESAKPTPLTSAATPSAGSATNHDQHAARRGVVPNQDLALL